MSGLINKAKDMLHSDKKDNAATNDPHSSNAGPHGSNVANKADPRVDSDRDNLGTHGTHTGTGAGIGSGTHGTHTGTGAGLGSTTHGTTTHGTTGAGYGGNTAAGPHSSNLANKADPRVDSDRDGRGIGQGVPGTTATGGGYGSNTHGTHTGTGAGLGSATHGTHTSAGAGLGSATHGNTAAGPHSSNLANKVDPRVDSDRDGRGIGQGAPGTTATGGGYGANTHSSTGAGLGSATHGTTGGYGNDPRSTNAGPHGSNVANKVDPRVDSDLDSGRQTGFGTSGHGHTGAGYAGTNPTSTTGAGYGSGTTGHAGAATHGAGAGAASALPGSGNADKTAGPHNSNLLNKLDPRVDSDLDGSKTVGGNATHQ